MTEKRFAVVNSGGAVENIIIARDGFELEGKTIVPVGHSKSAMIGGTYRDGTFTAPPVPEEMPPPAPTVAKEALWLRATDDEAEAIATALGALPARLRGIWTDSARLDHGGPMFPIIRDAIASAVGGKKRADELLSPEDA